MSRTLYVQVMIFGEKSLRVVHAVFALVLDYRLREYLLTPNFQIAFPNDLLVAPVLNNAPFTDPWITP